MLTGERGLPITSALRFLCVYNEPSTDLCLHKNLYLANVHHRAFKRDGVQGIQIEWELAYSVAQAVGKRAGM